MRGQSRPNGSLITPEIAGYHPDGDVHVPYDREKAKKLLAEAGYAGGFDVTLANEDPNRLVPLDTVRELERAGRLGRVHDAFYTTTGNGTPVVTATRFGQEIARELRDAGVQAVLLSGT